MFVYGYMYVAYLLRCCAHADEITIRSLRDFELPLNLHKYACMYVTYVCLGVYIWVYISGVYVHDTCVYTWVMYIKVGL
jgi:hypothetical protein